MGSPLNSSARYNSVTSAATITTACLHGGSVQRLGGGGDVTNLSPFVELLGGRHLEVCKQLHSWKPFGPMTTIWLAFDSLYFANRCDGQSGVQGCCSEQGLVSRISCHSLVRDLRQHTSSWSSACCAMLSRKLAASAPDDSETVAA